MNSSGQIVVIGNGGAAAHAVMAARRAGFTGEIHQVSDDIGPGFNPMLSPYYLKGILSWEQCFPFGPDFYKTHAVTCHFGSPAVFLDTNQNKVFLDNGRYIQYEKCLIATGARPATPPIPGLSGSGRVFPLRTPGSVLRIQKAIGSAKKAVVLGASLVGVKVAEILSRKGIVVVLLDVAAQVFPGGAHQATAALLQQYLAHKGIEVRLGCSLEGIGEGSGGVCCFLPGGITEDADFVAVCTGIQPNAGFVDPRGIAMDQAILVNRYMQTTAPDVYAAGDVCQARNRISGKNEWLGTWISACGQGRTAGANMAGAYRSWEGGIPQNISPVYDWVYAQIGNVRGNSPDHRIEISGDPFAGEGRFKLLAYDGDVLAGANLINCSREAAFVKNAIISGKSRKKSFPDGLLSSVFPQRTVYLHSRATRQDDLIS